MTFASAQFQRIWSLDYKPTVDDIDDEFNTSTLNSKWTAVDGTAGTVTLRDTGTTGIYDLATRPGTLLMQIGAAANDSVLLRQDATLADGASVVVSLAGGFDWVAAISSNEFAVGLGLNDTDTGVEDGDDLQFILDADAGLVTIDGVHSGRSADIGVADAGREYGGGDPIYLRIVRSTLTYHLHWSYGKGSSWNYKGSRTVSTALNNLWLFAEARATITNSMVIAVDWFRQGGNAFDPW